MINQYIKVPGIGSIYRRNKIWYLDYSVDGIRTREKGSPNKAVALELMKSRITESGRVGAPLKKQLVFFSAFADQYIDIKANGPKPKRSIRSIRGYLSHLKSFFGDLPLSRITPELVEEYQRKRESDNIGTIKNKDPRRVKGGSINREIATLRNIFNTARKKKLFRGDNPVADIVFYPETRRRHYILKADEYSRLVNAADPRLRPIIQVAVQTGLRKNDILNLKRRDIDIQRHTLTAWVSKTQEWKTFRIGEDLERTLIALRGSGDYVFSNPKTGKKWNDIKKWWEAAKTKAGLDVPGLLIFHDLRANSGIRVEGAEGAYAAQIHLGHKSLKTTQIYLGLPEERAQSAAKALQDFFKVRPEAPDTNAAQGQGQKSANVSESTH